MSNGPQEDLDKRALLQSLRNQLVIMQSLSQLLPSLNIAQNWIMSESQRTTTLMSQVDGPQEYLLSSEQEGCGFMPNLSVPAR